MVRLWIGSLKPPVKHRFKILRGKISKSCSSTFAHKTFISSDAIGAEIDSTGKPNSVGGEIHYIRCDVRDEENIKVKIAVQRILH